jgi:hypothetical protein
MNVNCCSRLGLFGGNLPFLFLPSAFAELRRDKREPTRTDRVRTTIKTAAFLTGFIRHHSRNTNLFGGLGSTLVVTQSVGGDLGFGGHF